MPLPGTDELAWEQFGSGFFYYYYFFFILFLMRFPTGSAIRFPRVVAGEPDRAGSWAAPRASGARPQEPGSLRQALGSLGRAGRRGAGSRTPAGRFLCDPATGPVTARVTAWVPAAVGATARDVAGGFPREGGCRSASVLKTEVEWDGFGVRSPLSEPAPAMFGGC